MPVTRRSIAHALAFALQGVVLLLLLDSAREFAAALIGAFVLAGFVLAYLWHRWEAIPHAVDMCVGMLTLGNLGMLLGSWADNGFSALPDSGCCHCVAALRDGVMRPWMWIGMLAFANAAMTWLGRHVARPGPCHVAAMFSGGNVGMVLGMLAGGWCAAQVGAQSSTDAAVLSFLAMTAGMLVGMLLGTWWAEKLIERVRRWRITPHWFRTGGVTRSAG